MLWFACVTIPVLFFSAGISVDLTRIVVAKREASNLASAAAVAGAYQFEPGKPYLDRERAKAEAERTWEYGRRAGDSNAARLLERGERVRVDLGGSYFSPTVVEVRVDYTISDLLFTRYFLQEDEFDYSLTRRAFVCVPEEAEDPTAGYCVRPQ